MKREPNLAEQVFQLVAPFLFLLCLGTLLWFCSKIVGGCCGPEGRDYTQIVLGTSLNLLILIIKPALFCVFETWQLLSDLWGKSSGAQSVLFLHFLKATLPVLCFILGKLCWKTCVANDRSKISRSASQPDSGDKGPVLEPVGEGGHAKSFLQELVVFSLIFLALMPFQSRIMQAPNDLVENARLFIFGQEIIAASQPSSPSWSKYQVIWDELRLAETYGNLGRYKEAFNTIDSIIAENRGPKTLDRLCDIYWRLRNIDSTNRLSATQWLSLTDLADKNLAAIFRISHPVQTADGEWNRNKNEVIYCSLAQAARGLIRSYLDHGCTERAIAWMEMKARLRRKLLGAELENRQRINNTLRWDKALSDERESNVPLLQEELALLECAPLSKSKDSWSEHWREENLRDCLDELAKITGVESESSTDSSKQTETRQHPENDEALKAQMEKELAVAERSGDYLGAKNKARDIARHIHRYENTVSKDAASYYNRMVSLEEHVQMSKEEQLNDLLEALHSNLECGNLKQGQVYQAKIQVLKNSLFGERYIGKARDLNSQGLIYMQLGKPTLAKPLYEEALRLDTKTLGAGNKSIAIYLNNLGHISKQLKDFAHAEQYYRQAMQIDKSAPADTLAVADDYENLGKLYLDEKQRGDALKNLLAARDTKSKVLGADAVEVVELDKIINSKELERLDFSA